MRRGLGAGVVALVGLQRRVNRDGTVRWYYRRKGQPIVRLPDLPTDHPDFLAAYVAARQATRPRGQPGPGTIDAMAAEVMHAHAWRQFSISYQTIMRRHINAIRDQGSGAKMRDLRPRHIETDLGLLAPSVARARLKAWRYLCQRFRWSDYGLADPSVAVARPKMPKGEGHPPWSAGEIAAYRARWPIGTVARAVFEALFRTGARVSDVVRIGPGMVGRDGVLAYKQQKTGGTAYVP